MVCIVGFIGKQITGLRQGSAKHDSTLDVGGLARCQIENQRTALLVAYGVNLGVTASFGAANGLSRGPPFPPPAQRWALT